MFLNKEKKMRCKSCWRECGPATYVAEFGMQIAPAYCNERHGGLNRTLIDLRKQTAETENNAADRARMKVGGGLSEFRSETDEQREARLKKAHNKSAKREADRRASHKPKKQKGKKNNKGGGEKKGKKDKPDKNARKAARHGAIPAPQPAPTTATPNNPPASPPAAKE